MTRSWEAVVYSTRAKLGSSCSSGAFVAQVQARLELQVVCFFFGAFELAFLNFFLVSPTFSPDRAHAINVCLVVARQAAACV